MEFKEQYMNKANNLMERLLDEQPDDEEEVDIETGEDESDDAEEEKGQAGQIEVFFDNLDEASQKVLIDKIKENLNVTEDDDYAHQKLVDAFAKKPLVTFRAEELVRKLNLDI